MQTLKVMTNFETFKYVSKFVMIFQSLRGMFQSLSFQSLHLRPYPGPKAPVAPPRVCLIFDEHALSIFVFLQVLLKGRRV